MREFPFLCRMLWRFIGLTTDDAVYENEFEKNLQLLEDSFTRLQLPRAVEGPCNAPFQSALLIQCNASIPVWAVDKLKKGTFQHNLDFLQWMYGLVDRNYPTAHLEYPGYQRRLDALKVQFHQQHGRTRSASLQGHVRTPSSTSGSRTPKSEDEVRFSKPELLAHRGRCHPTVIRNVCEFKLHRSLTLTYTNTCTHFHLLSHSYSR